MRYFLLLAVFLTAVAVTPAQFQGTLTFFNNSADPELNQVTVYVYQAGVEVLVETIAFGEVNNGGFLDLFAGTQTEVKVSKAGAGPGAAIATHSFVPEEATSYLAVLVGVSSTDGFATNPDGTSTASKIAFSQIETDAGTDTESGAHFVHGATDAERADLWVRGGTTAKVPGIGYGSASDMITIPAETVTIDITRAGQKSVIIGSFSVNATLFQAEVAALILGGFKTPEANGDGSKLVLFGIMPNGSVIKYPLLEGSQNCRVQFVHNSPDNRINMSNLWLNTERIASNLQFRYATPFMDLPAGTPLIVGISPAAGTAYKDTLKTTSIPSLRAGRKYTFIMTGVVDTASFTKNPDGRPADLTIQVWEDALESSDDDAHVVIRAGHQVSDAPAMTLSTASGVTLGSGMAYGEFSIGYIPVAKGTDTLWLRDAAADTVVTGFVMPLMAGKRPVVALVSGFQSATGNGASPASFRVILIDVNGNVTRNLQEVGKIPDWVEYVPAFGSGWQFSPMPVKNELNIAVSGALEQERASALTSFTIVNVLGEVAAHIDVSNTYAPYRINATTFAPGNYIIYGIRADGSIVGSQAISVVR